MPGCRIRSIVQTPVLSSHRDRPLRFGLHFKPDPACLLRNKIRKTIGPLDHRDAVTAEVIIEPETYRGLAVFQSKEIEMINGQSAAEVLVDDRKCRACDDGGAGQ